MGIRVKKILGYALTNVKCKDGNIIDKRFNPNGFAMMGYEDQDINYTIFGFKKYLKSIPESNDNYYVAQCFAGYLSDNKNVDFNDLTFYDEEYGDPKVYIFSSRHNDKRYDDSIDYYTEITSRKNAEPYVKNIPNGIHPWDGFYFNLKTNSRMQSVDGISVSILRNIRHDSKLFESAIKKFGFTDVKDFDKNVVPIVSPEVQFLCEYLEIFKDPATIHTLKPVLYTVWS